jgi:hypothetical protein
MMKKCNKCEIEKDDTEFKSYLHSTQNKIRTRGICQKCIKLQKREYKRKLKKEIIPEKLKKCTFCLIEKPIIAYYNNGEYLRSYCNECHNKKQREKNHSRLIEKGGNDRVRILPDDYEDVIQKHNVFQFLELLGYVYNNGIWEKPGYKKVVDGKIIFNYDYHKTK